MKTIIQQLQLRTIIPLALALLALLAYQYMGAAWTNPPANPPNNNVPAPINVGTSTESRQVLQGALGMDSLGVFGKAYVQGDAVTATPTTLVDFDVQGNIGADEYCDRNGTNCFTAAEVGTGTGTGAVPSNLNLNGIFDTWPDAVLCTTGVTQYSLDLMYRHDGAVVYGDTGDSDDVWIQFDRNNRSYYSAKFTFEDCVNKDIDTIIADDQAIFLAYSHQPQNSLPYCNVRFDTWISGASVKDTYRVYGNLGGQVGIGLFSHHDDDYDSFVYNTISPTRMVHASSWGGRLWDSGNRGFIMYFDPAAVSSRGATLQGYTSTYNFEYQTLNMAPGPQIRLVNDAGAPANSVATYAQVMSCSS